MLHLRLVPVDEGARVVGPLPDEVLVDLALSVADEVLDDPFLVDFDAEVFLDLAVERIDVPGVDGACAGLLDQQHLGTELCQFERSDHARVAAADHDHFVVLGFGYLIGNRSRLVEYGSLRFALACGAVGSFGGCRLFRRAARKGAYGGKRPGCSGSGQKAAAR